MSEKLAAYFSASGGSGFGKTVQELKSSISSTTDIIEGKLLNGRISENALALWIESLNI